jgi:hypothetical protein
MAALVGSRHNSGLKAIHDRLRADGKSPKEALVACMRALHTRSGKAFFCGAQTPAPHHVDAIPKWCDNYYGRLKA